ncbi:MAG: hypothetical protein JWQ78_457 [Sediminibacterium sp.]|nr:hypothetical protein [Sediminibacterium sp.]
MKRVCIFFSFIILAVACKEKYLPQLNLPAASFLVVEGYINSGAGATTITLTRSTKVVDTATKVFERNAEVTVQGETGSSVKLTEVSPGVYSIAQLALNAATRYRLAIKTQNGKQYQSDFTEVRKTPDIDSVSWKRRDGGVQTYVNTHDPLNKAQYYQWKYDETWEFHSKYPASLKLNYNANHTKVISLGYRDSLSYGNDSSILVCWKNTSLTSINIGSSEKLTQAVISEQPTAFIPLNSQQLSVLYSINVKQYAISDKGYRFLQQLKKNTEQLGTIFDAQPSDNMGNIHCITNPAEIAIGFVEVLEEKQKRLFISIKQVPDWRYKPNCEDQEKVLNNPDSLTRASAGGIVTTIAEADIAIKYVFFGSPVCVDCTRTGSNKKPVFWP